jgi:hypothetical protein
MIPPFIKKRDYLTNIPHSKLFCKHSICMFKVRLKRKTPPWKRRRGVFPLCKGRPGGILLHLIMYYFLGGLVSTPGSPQITFTRFESLGAIIFALLVRDCSTACNLRSSCALPTKQASADSLTSLIACASPSATTILACFCP